MKNRITAHERLQLIGLMTIAQKHMKMVDEASSVMDAIIESDESEKGWTLLNDAIYEGKEPDVDQILKNMGIKVTK